MKRLLSILLVAFSLFAMLPGALASSVLIASIWTPPSTSVIFAGPQAVVADYFSNVVSLSDLHIIKWLPNLYRRYGNQGLDVIDMLQLLGFERTESVEIVRHFEENWIHQNFQVQAATAGATGATKQIALSPNSVDAQGRYYPRVSDTVTFPNQTTAKIIAISGANPPVLTLQPFDATKNIPAVSADDYLIITGNTFSEGSTQPVGRYSAAWKYENYMQIVKESLGASGTEMTNESWVKSVDGKGIQGWYQKGLMDVDFRMRTNVQGTWLTQELNTNNVQDPLNGNATLKTTEGFFPTLRRLGIPYPYIPGQLTVQDFNAINRYLNSQFASTYTCVMMGQEVDFELEDVLTNSLKYTNVEFATKNAQKKLFGDGTEQDYMAVNFGFNYLTKGSRTFCLKRFDALTNPQTFGAPGYNYTGRAVFFPLERAKDPKSKNSIPAIGIVWKGMGDYSRRMEMWNYGSAGSGPKIGPIDRRDWYMRTEFSCEFFGVNQMVDMYVS